METKTVGVGFGMPPQGRQPTLGAIASNKAHTRDKQTPKSRVPNLFLLVAPLIPTLISVAPHVEKKTYFS